MKVALIGAGNIATVHGPIVQRHPRAELAAIADRERSRALALSRRLGAPPCYGDALAMLEEVRPDVVHVLTPPATHRELAVAALERGCHVLVEKPFAPDHAEARRILDAARDAGRLVCVNHNMVFEHSVQKALAVFRSGSLGRLVSVEAVYQFDPRRYPAILEEGAELSHWTYRLQGGPLEDLLPHPASLICELLPQVGEVEVSGANRGWLPGQWWDELRITAGAPSVLGSITISLSARPDVITYTIKGSEGMVEADLFADTVVVRRTLGLPRAALRGLSGFQTGWQHLAGSVGNIGRFARGKVDKSNGLQPLVERFYRAVDGLEPPPVAPEAALKVSELMAQVWPAAPAAPPEPAAAPLARRRPPAGSRAEVLVTGASGFIGTHLVSRLTAQGRRVRALVRPNSQNLGRLAGAEVEVMEGDLADPEVPLAAAAGVHTVYHAGSPMGGDWDEFRSAAVEGTDRLLKASLAAGVQRFVQFSSLNVYDLLRAGKGQAIDEDWPLQGAGRGLNPYAWAKIECERMALAAWRDHGLGASVVRPGMVIGPRGRVFFPHLGYNFQERTFLLIGGGRIPLALTYVENTVEGVILAGTRPEAVGRVYNLVDDGEITARQYVDRFLEFSQAPATVVNLPYSLVYGLTMLYEAVAGLGLVKAGATSRDQLRWKQALVRFDNSRAKSELGWEPRVPLSQGLDETFRWYADRYRR